MEQPKSPFKAGRFHIVFFGISFLVIGLSSRLRGRRVAPVESA
jgi:hypothetical protein